MTTTFSSRFLFRFCVPCPYVPAKWSNVGVVLPEECRLPDLMQLDALKSSSEIRVGWNQDALFVTVDVRGKKQPVWCRDSKLEDSDGLQVWIDARDTKNIHRAGRFCHRFAFLPAGAGRSYEQPTCDQLLVDRARENANPIRPGMLKVHAARRADGYYMACLIPTAAITGFNPADHPRLGFTYWLGDRELGEQTLSLGSEFPFAADPSLWASLELQPAKKG